MRLFASFIFLIAISLFAGSAVIAQETEERVVDEVVAVVNEGVITLSKVKREQKSIVDTEVQQGKKREEVEKMVDERRGEMIANLVYEELIMQKAKELGYENEVDANVNRRFLEIMKQYNLKTLDALYAEMEKTGVNPQEIRELWKKQATREMLIQKEVQAKIYWGASAKEVKDYYEAHKDKFTKPETVTLGEIFLSYAGRDENAVREKAKQLLADLRKGGDFEKIAKENSDPVVVTVDGAKKRMTDLLPLVVTALKGVNVGGYTEPIVADQVGVVILKVEAHEKATSESYFDEAAVRMAIVAEKAPEEQKKFLASLRGDAYIKISDSYRPTVSPILFAEDRKEKSSEESVAPKTSAKPDAEKPADGKSNKKSSKKSDTKSTSKK
jgi:peptidyl-prolyl cis-trans isomerase SurA